MIVLLYVALLGVPAAWLFSEFKGTRKTRVKRGQKTIAFEELGWVGWHIPISSNFSPAAIEKMEDDFHTHADANRRLPTWSTMALLFNLAIAVPLTFSCSCFIELFVRRVLRAKLAAQPPS